MSKAQHIASRDTHLEAPAHLPRAPYAAHTPINPQAEFHDKAGLFVTGTASRTPGEKVPGTELPLWALQHQALPASDEHLE